MKLMPGCQEEYKRRHDALWPAVQQLLKENGIKDYSIFLDEETNILFGVQQQGAESSSQDLGQYPIIKKWWAYMADIMETNADHSPVTSPLKMVFHMD